MPKIFGVNNTQLFVGLTIGFGLFLFWSEPDSLIKFGGIGVIVLLIFFYDKIIGNTKKDVGDFDYSPDDLASNDDIKEDLLRELELNSHEPVILAGDSVVIKTKHLKPPIFIYEIKKKNDDRLLGIGNALKGAKERMLTAPIEFERLGYYYGERNLADIATKLWPSRKELSDEEYKEKLIQDLRKQKSGGVVL